MPWQVREGGGGGPASAWVMVGSGSWSRSVWASSARFGRLTIRLAKGVVVRVLHVAALACPGDRDDTGGGFDDSGGRRWAAELEAAGTDGPGVAEDEEEHGPAARCRQRRSTAHRVLWVKQQKIACSRRLRYRGGVPGTSDDEPGIVGRGIEEGISDGGS